MSDAQDREVRRYEMQLALDAEKSHLARNEMGQFSTPFLLACDIMRRAKGVLTADNALFLEPAFGTGVFLSAFKEAFGRMPRRTLGFEIDPHYAVPSKKHWHDAGLELRCLDFLAQRPEEKFDLLVTNPPYSRHHHIPGERSVAFRIAALV